MRYRLTYDLGGRSHEINGTGTDQVAEAEGFMTDWRADPDRVFRVLTADGVVAGGRYGDITYARLEVWP